MKIGIVLSAVMVVLGLTAVIGGQFVDRGNLKEQMEKELSFEGNEAAVSDVIVEGDVLDSEWTPLLEGLKSFDDFQDMTSDGEAVVASASQIKDEYEEKFSNLQEEAIALIRDLVDEAIADYQEKAANDEGISLWYFYRTYYGTARDIEAQIDERFYTKYAELESELAANGHSLTKAETFRNKYEETKSELLNTFISMVF
ncbi:hypothetical protein J2S74_004079 [Evansella vedderi]|uniref:Uncharacterized protein n=1 Tax=Evansella vedderi TaxID=38282 RepID=A0ABT9ZZJ3_9BACI|nr:hypothetical protein [Evansella vedderi]MDQ0256657.1 hypothetical protein [Evansella vedderi]